MMRRTNRCAVVLNAAMLAVSMTAAAQSTGTTPQAPTALAAIQRQPKPDSGAANWGTGAYTYDQAGNIAFIGSDAYLYDGENRLAAFTPATGPMSAQSYSYDVYGNLTSSTLSGTIAVIGSTNHLDPSARSAAYDDAGNLTQWQPQDSGLRTFTYDPFNMVQEVVVGGVVKRRYVYTAGDERVRVDDLSATPAVSDFTLRGLTNQELRDVRVQGSSWSLSRDFIYRGGSLLANATPTAVEHNSLDHLGTPRLVTDQSGVRIGRHDYYPFGAEAFGIASLSEGNPRHFTAHERDADPGGGNKDLDYMHARYYDAAVGRFLSVDPTWSSADLGRPQSWNRYSYVLNNPLRYTDPDGRVTDVWTSALWGFEWGNVPGAVICAGVSLAVGYGLTHPAEVAAMGNSDRGGSAGERYAENWIRQNNANHMSERQEQSKAPGGRDQADKPADTKNSNNDDDEPREVTPSTNKGDFTGMRGRDAKVNKETGEVWVRDRLHRDHWEVYKNQKEYENGYRTRAVWDDGRLKETF
jgi:RHS repeat-associated protein